MTTSSSRAVGAGTDEGTPARKQREGLRHFDVANHFLSDASFIAQDTLHLRYWRGSFWRWDGSVYQEWSDGDATAAIMRYLQARRDFRGHCTRHFVSNVRANIEAICALASPTAPPAWLTEHDPCAADRCIAMANGILDLNALLSGENKVLRPHTAAFFSVNVLPYGFDENATCVLWESTLERILPDPQSRELLREWCGYCLLPESWLQVFLILLGDGANGKSLVCKTLTNLLGESNVSAVPIERFRETHELVATLGKLANITAEFEEIDRATEGTLKAYVAGDPMEFNPKYKTPFTARPTARLVVATNDLPHVRDKSSGLWRRMAILRFPVRIPRSEQDPHLVEKLNAELPGILNWALVGLFRLLERGTLTEPRDSMTLREEHRRTCNSARAFIEEYLVHAPGHVLEKQVVYDQYKAIVKDRGYQPMNEAHFAQEVYRYFGDRVTPGRRRLVDTGVRRHIYEGLDWAGDEDVADESEDPSLRARVKTSASVPSGPTSPGHLAQTSNRRT